MTTEQIKWEFAQAVDRLAAAGLPHTIVEVGVIAYIADLRGIELNDVVDALIDIGGGRFGAAEQFNMVLEVEPAEGGFAKVRWVDGEIVLAATTPVNAVLALGMFSERAAWTNRYTTPGGRCA